MDPKSQHIAEFNIGTLRYDWDDPRVKDFADGLDAVNGLAERSAGFVWRMSDEDMEAAQSDPQGRLGHSPRTASTLSVWQDAKSLEHFVWNTIHRQYYNRKDDWYAPTDELRLVMWWIPAGHYPTIDEAVERFEYLKTHGVSDFAFGWDGLKDAYLWRGNRCGHLAAE